MGYSRMGSDQQDQKGSKAGHHRRTLLDLYRPEDLTARGSVQDPGTQIKVDTLTTSRPDNQVNAVTVTIQEPADSINIDNVTTHRLNGAFFLGLVGGALLNGMNYWICEYSSSGKAFLNSMSLASDSVNTVLASGIVRFRKPFWTADTHPIEHYGVQPILHMGVAVGVSSLYQALTGDEQDNYDVGKVFAQAIVAPLAQVAVEKGYFLAKQAFFAAKKCLCEKEPDPKAYRSLFKGSEPEPEKKENASGKRLGMCVTQ